MAATSISAQPAGSSNSGQRSGVQKRPIPVHVLDQEYEMVHQVGPSKDTRVVQASCGH